METEIQYQKHMIENLGRWFSLFFTIASIGLVLVYFSRQINLIAFVLGMITVLGILAMLVLVYGIYKGRLNPQKVIDDFEEKLRLVDKNLFAFP